MITAFKDIQSIWDNIIPSKEGPLNYLEVGLYFGENFVNMLQKHLDHSESHAVGIDAFVSPRDNIEENFHSNLSKVNVKTKIEILKGNSRELIRTLQPGYFDLIFIDGNHTSAYTLSDIVQAWETLKEGGHMIIDDYKCVNPVDFYSRRRKMSPSLYHRLAVNSFLASFQNELELIYKGTQVVVKKHQNLSKIDGSWESAYSMVESRYGKNNIYNWQHRTLNGVEISLLKSIFIEFYLRLNTIKYIFYR